MLNDDILGIQNKNELCSNHMQLDAKQQVVQKDAKCQWYSCMSDDQENEPQTKILSGLEQSSEIHASVSNNKVLKNEINLDILNKFLDALELIENGEVDQHEASVKVGTFLKELYVDSALRKTEKMDAENSNNDDEKNDIMEISWSEYKRVRS